MEKEKSVINIGDVTERIIEAAHKCIENEEMEKMITATRLCTAMRRKGISKAELARRTGLSKASITQYTKGDVKPKQDRIYILSEALNISPSWLMGITDNEINFSSRVFSMVDKIDDKDTINIINKLFRLNKTELKMVESIIDTYLNNKK